jgi:hypothetical protein
MWHMFVALSAACCPIICGGDVKDACAHAPGPKKPTFVCMDDTMIDWWHNKTGECVTKDKLAEILCAVQGHLEAGCAWEIFISEVLCDIGFHNATHKKNIHQMPCDGSVILVARQVNDFALACVDDDTACSVIAKIGKHIRLPSESVAPIDFQGVLTTHNGHDVSQTSECIHLSPKPCLWHVLKNHAWEKPDKCESLLTAKPKSPLSNEEAKLMCSVAPGPKEGTKEHATLACTVGCGHCNLLGELLYAHILCRLNVSFTIATLAKFSMHPATKHCRSKMLGPLPSAHC